MLASAGLCLCFVTRGSLFDQWYYLQGAGGLHSRACRVCVTSLLLHFGVILACHQATSGPSGQQPMQVPAGWDQPPQQGTAVPGKEASSTPDVQTLPQQQGTAANSKDGTGKDAAPAGGDSAKPTGVKSAAGSGLRGSLGLWQAVAAGAVVLLVL
jgi:hypothetical protein